MSKEASDREGALQLLDRRHLTDFSKEALEALDTKLIDICMGPTAGLAAIRLSSLFFWYAYVAPNKAYIHKSNSSDIGDFYHMSLIPYCSAICLDQAMKRLVTNIFTEVDYPCTIIDNKKLDTLIER